MRPVRLTLAFFAFLTFLAGAVPGRMAHAHGMRIAYLELTERGGAFEAVFKKPDGDPSVHPIFPADCFVEERTERTLIDTFILRCNSPLAGQTLSVSGLGPVVSDAVLRVAFLDGTVLSRVLTPESPAFEIPRRRDTLQLALEYTLLGAEHIWGGADHLLFVLALVLLVRRPKAALVTVTAFTAAHSLTLGATVLGWVEVPSAAAEACIALSLVFVALDIGRPARDSRGRAAAFVFGLVHGFGFAGALSEIGLPRESIGLALASFNAGVELGQLAFVGAALLTLAAAERAGRSAALERTAATLVGSLGVFWLIERASQVI